MLPTAIAELEKNINGQRNIMERVVEVFLKNLRSLDYIGATHEN